VYNSTLRIFNMERYVGWGYNYTEPFYAIIPTLFTCFLPICYISYIFSFMSFLLAAGACLS